MVLGSCAAVHDAEWWVQAVPLGEQWGQQSQQWCRDELRTADRLSGLGWCSCWVVLHACGSATWFSVGVHRCRL